MLAIPHNGNLSNGRMFTVETFDGKPLTKELAAMRVPATNRSSRSPRSRVTGKRIRCCRRTTSSPTTRTGTSRT